jgi:hypothetical protein
MADEDLTETIADNAAAPASVSGDAGSMTQHNLTDLIAADKYLASKRATLRPHDCLRRVRLVPPGGA